MKSIFMALFFVAIASAELDNVNFIQRQKRVSKLSYSNGKFCVTHKEIRIEKKIKRESIFFYFFSFNLFFFLQF